MSDDASTLMPAPGPSKARPDAVVTLTILYHPDIARLGERAQLCGCRRRSSRGSPVRLAGHVRQLRNAARQLAISSRGASEVRLDPALERLLGNSHDNATSDRGSAEAAPRSGRHLRR